MTYDATDFDDILAAIEAHAAAAAAAANVDFTDVTAGFPYPRSERTGRVTWVGEEPPWDMTADRSLNSKLVGDRILLRFMWVVGTLDEAAHRSRTREVWTVADEVGTRLRGDMTLGGLVVGVDVEPAESDEMEFGGALYIVLDIYARLSHREQETTA